MSAAAIATAPRIHAFDFPTDARLNAYIAYIRAVACEAPDCPVIPPPTPPIPAPDIVLATIFAQIGNDTPTRFGLDAALDHLFAHPDIAPLLLTLSPTTFADRVLPRTHPRFADHWTHIVIPAWEQHVAFLRAVAASALVPTPENAVAAANATVAVPPPPS